MKTFNVVWYERMSVNVQAETPEEACEIVLSCGHDENDVASELDQVPEAFEITN